MQPCWNCRSLRLINRHFYQKSSPFLAIPSPNWLPPLYANFCTPPCSQNQKVQNSNRSEVLLWSFGFNIARNITLFEIFTSMWCWSSKPANLHLYLVHGDFSSLFLVWLTQSTVSFSRVCFNNVQILLQLNHILNHKEKPLWWRYIWA